MMLIPLKPLPDYNEGSTLISGTGIISRVAILSKKFEFHQVQSYLSQLLGSLSQPWIFILLQCTLYSYAEPQSCLK